MAKFKILSTKPIDPRLHKLAEENDIEIIEKEFISTSPVWDKPSRDRILDIVSRPAVSIALTSSRAVEILHQHLAAEQIRSVDWKVFCLSGKTAATLKTSGLSKVDIVAEAPDASALARLIIRSGQKQLFFFCSDRRRNELPELLEQAGVKLMEVILYRTELNNEVFDEHVDGVLFFSPSAVESFFAVNALARETPCFAIGATTAKSLETHTTGKIMTAEAADQELMIREVIGHFNRQVSKGA